MSAILPASTGPTVFDFEGRAVKIVNLGGNPWFVLADVCRVLEITNVGNAAARLKPEEKDDIRLTDAIGRSQQTLIISEPGFYRLVLRSDKPQADKFQTWVVKDVLPSIRKTGSYGPPAAPTTREQQIAQALLLSQDVIREKDERIAELVPKAVALDLIATSRDALCFREAAKVLQMPPNHLR